MSLTNQGVVMFLFLAFVFLHICFFAFSFCKKAQLQNGRRLQHGQTKRLKKMLNSC